MQRNYCRLLMINTMFSLVGFDRLPLDPHWVEAQRRYAASIQQAGAAQLGPGGSHIPGVYHPTSLANDLLQRERERIERLGKDWGTHCECSDLCKINMSEMQTNIVPLM